MHKRIWGQNKNFLTGMAFLFCVACVVFSVLQMQVTANATQTGSSDWSLEHVANAASQFLNRSVDPEVGTQVPKITGTADLYAGQAGGLLGYQNSFEQESAFLVAGTDSGNTVQYSYAALRRNVPYEGGDSFGKALAGYGYFGYALGQMGLDETSMVGNAGSLRQILGIVMLALYALCASIQAFFHLVMGMLRFANPFRIFAWIGTVSAGWMPSYGNAIMDMNGAMGTSVGGTISGAINRFATWISDYYDTLASFAQATIIPLLLAFALFTWLVINKGGGFVKTFKNFYIKCLFIVLGVPLMFGAYDAALGWVGDFNAVGHGTGSKVILSTFFDFEKWALNSNLSLKNVGADIVVNLDANGDASVAPATIARSRYFIAKLNALNYNGGTPGSVITDVSGSVGSSSLNAAEALHQYNIGMMSSSGGASSTTETGAIVRMLQRYASGSIVSPASYQSQAISKIVSDASSTTSGSMAKRQALHAELNLTIIWDNFHSDRVTQSGWKWSGGSSGMVSGGGAIDEYYYDKTVLRDAAKTRFNVSGGDKLSYATQRLWSNGGLKATFGTAPTSSGAAGDDDGGDSLSGICKFSHDATVGTKKSIFSWRNANIETGLSTVGLYNYLSSSFDSDKITAYSAANTASNQVQVGHYAVTSVGTGLMKWIYLVDALVLLGCNAVIGYGYGLAMLFANFKALFKMIPGVFAGMVGSMRGIAAACALTGALIVEVVVTICLYSISMEIIEMMYDLVESPLLRLLTSVGGSSTTAFKGAILPVLFGLLSITLIVTLTGKLLEWRVAICQSFTEACTAMVNKMLGTSVNAPNLHDGMSLANAGSILASGMMAAAGMAGMDNADIRNFAGKGLDALTGKNGENGIVADLAGSLTGGSGGLGEGTGDENLTAEEKEAKKNGVKFGNGTGEVVGLTKASASGDEGWGVKERGESTAAGVDGKDGTNGDDDKQGLAGTDSDSGVKAAKSGKKNADGEAEDYVEANAKEFEALLSAGMEENKDVINAARQQDPFYKRKLASQAAESSKLTMTDTDGNTVSGLKAVNEDGTEYTAGDKADGRKCSLVDANGNVHVDSKGRAMSDIDSSNVQFDVDGNISGIVDADGNRSSLSSVGSSIKAVTDLNGVTTSGLKVVNAETGEAYTQVDKDNGTAYSVVDASGQVYTDSNGTSYANMSSRDVHVDGLTGQVDMIRDGNGNKAMVMSNDTVTGGFVVQSPDGTSAAGVQVINSATGAPYTIADRNAGAAFSVVNKDGSAFATNLTAAPASDVSINPVTGMVDAVRDSSKAEYVIQPVGVGGGSSGGGTMVLGERSVGTGVIAGDANTQFASTVATSTGTTYAAPVGGNYQSTETVTRTVNENVRSSGGEGFTPNRDVQTGFAYAMGAQTLMNGGSVAQAAAPVAQAAAPVSSAAPAVQAGTNTVREFFTERSESIVQNLAGGSDGGSGRMVANGYSGQSQPANITVQAPSASGMGAPQIAMNIAQSQVNQVLGNSQGASQSNIVNNNMFTAGDSGRSAGSMSVQNVNNNTVHMNNHSVNNVSENNSSFVSASAPQGNSFVDSKSQGTQSAQQVPISTGHSPQGGRSVTSGHTGRRK